MALSTQRASASFVSNESAPQWKYDVFLSFRGVDTRKGFVSHLYHELCKCQGITTFFDDRELEGGTSIHLELPSAIKESHIAIVVLSPNYASSKWCLNELTTILQCMEARNTVLPVFYETNPSDVGKQRGSFAKAFDEHEEKFISTEDKMKVTQWREALKKVSKISGWHSKESKCESELIEKIVQSVWRKVQATFTLLDSSQKFVGVNFRLEQLSSLLAHDANDVRFIGITGMGGIGMHDLIQEMAWTIVGQESKEPGLRSRLWLPDDIFHIFTTNTGTRTIEGIVLQLPEIEEVHWSCEAFSNMHGLRFLEFDNLIISSLPKFLPCSLRIMVWSYYPSKSLPPSFHLRFLTELRMRHSKLVRLWDGKENFPKLKCIDLSYSNKLIRTPDFTGLQNLEELDLGDCTKLVEIHPSIAVLKKLKVLNLRDCESIKSLPSEVEMDALEYLNLFGCSKVKKIPEFSNQMKCLSTLFIRGTGIEKLPSSIEHLVGLTRLSMNKCRRELFVDMKNLKSLSLCGPLAKARDDGPCWGFVLSSLYHLRCLEDLVLRYCDLGEGDIADDIGCLSSLKKLDLSGNSFVTLPASIKCLSRLEHLYLNECQRLEQLPDLPSNRKLYVYVSDCTSLKRLSDPSNLHDFAFSSLNCITLVEDEDWIKTIYSRIVKYATEKICRHPIVCPGKGIPEWFNNQTLGHALDVKLPPQSCSSWMGIAFCVVFAQPQENLRLLQKQKKNFRNPAAPNTDGFWIRCLLRTNRKQSARSSWCFTRPLVSEHLWIFYLPRKEYLQEQFLFETYYGLGMNKPKVGLNVVKKCGARLVYKTDLEELNRTLKILKRTHESCEEGASSQSRSFDDKEHTRKRQKEDK